MYTLLHLRSLPYHDSSFSEGNPMRILHCIIVNTLCKLLSVQCTLSVFTSKLFHIDILEFKTNINILKEVHILLYDFIRQSFVDKDFNINDSHFLHVGNWLGSKYWLEMHVSCRYDVSTSLQPWLHCRLMLTPASITSPGSCSKITPFRSLGTVHLLSSAATSITYHFITV